MQENTIKRNGTRIGCQFGVSRLRSLPTYSPLCIQAAQDWRMTRTKPIQQPMAQLWAFLAVKRLHEGRMKNWKRREKAKERGVYGSDRKNNQLAFFWRKATTSHWLVRFSHLGHVNWWCSTCLRKLYECLKQNIAKSRPTYDQLFYTESALPEAIKPIIQTVQLSV